MKRREREPLEKVCINLFEGDMNALQELHPRVGAGRAIRELVRSHILLVRQKATEDQRLKETA